MSTVLVSAGHNLRDPGAIANGTTESLMNRLLRDRLVARLDQLWVKTIVVPDDLTLRETIKWSQGAYARHHYSLALEIHLNAGPPKAHGAEIFYKEGDLTEKSQGTFLMEHTCEPLGLFNRGAKPDTMAAVGRLGFCREVPKALLVEACFITNKADLSVLQKDHGTLWADVWARALVELLGHGPNPETR